MLVSLGSPPTTPRIGVGLHGHVPTECYRTESLWHLHLYRYDGELIVDGGRFALKPGYASLLPPCSTYEHHFAHDSLHLYAYLELSSPSSAERLVEVPTVQDLGNRFGPCWEALEQTLTYWYRQPARANAVLWYLLWELSEAPTDPAIDTEQWHHPGLWRALHHIELHFAEPLTVADVANHAGVSSRQLRHLFRRATDMTVIGYIRARRVDEAVKLLTRTELPIKAIAADVGIPDLSAFNKTVRGLTGKPPRAHRHRG